MVCVCICVCIGDGASGYMLDVAVYESNTIGQMAVYVSYLNTSLLYTHLYVGKEEMTEMDHAKQV